MRRPMISAVAILTLSAGLSGLHAQDKKVTFEDDVKPIFRQHCFSCHNPDKKSGSLDLTTYTSLMQGGSSGDVIEAGDASLSYLYMLVTHESEPFMPPNADKIPQDKIDVLKKWIDGGVLETASSKAKMSSKPKVDLSLKDAPSGRPEGPPPMPGLLSLQPQVRTSRATAVTAIATSPWAPLAAVAGQQQILLYNTKTLQIAAVLPFPEGDPLVLKFSRNGRLLLAGGGHAAAMGKVIVFDVATGERIVTVGDELDAVLAADISADQRFIALGGPSKVVRIYSTADGSLLHEIRKHTDWVYSLEFSPDSVLLATGDRNGGLHVWEAYTAREYLTLQGHTAAVTAISWRSDSNILATASEDNNISLWELNNGGRIKNWGAHGGGATSMEFCRDGRLVSCGRDKVAKLWDQNGQQLRAFPALPDIATSVSFCDETENLITGDWSGLIKVYASADGAERGDLSANPPKIEERLAGLQEQLKGQNTTLAQQTEAAKPIVAAWEKAKADLAAAQKMVADTNKAAEEAKAKSAALAAQVDQLTKEKAAADLQVATLTPVVTSLKTALDQTTAAAAKLPEDKNLAAATAAVKGQHDEKAGALAAQQKLQAEKGTALQKATADKTAADKVTETTAAAYAAAVKTQETATAAVPPAEEQAKAAQAQVAQAQQAVTATNTQIQYWTRQLQLDQKLTQKTGQTDLLAQAQAAEADVKTLFDAAQGELNASQTTAAEAQKALDTVAAQLAAEQKTLEQKTGELKGLQGQMATLDGAIPVLTESSQKADEVAAKLKEDKEIEAAAKAIKDLLAKKTAEAAELKKQVEAKQGEVNTQTAKVAEVTKQMETAQAALAAAQKVVADKTAALKPVAEKYESAKAATAQATQALDAVAKEIEQIRAALQPPANEQASK